MGLYHHIGGEAGSKGKYWHPKRRLVGKYQRREKGQIGSGRMGQIQ